MASCGSLRHIFENPLPENPSLIESLSCRPIRTLKSIDHSFTELFGELHFKENNNSDDHPLPADRKNDAVQFTTSYSGGKSTNISHPHLLNSESLHLCTEGLGFESLDDVEDLLNDSSSSSLEEVVLSPEEKGVVREQLYFSDQYKISKSCGSSYPPPISSIGREGKPWVSFESYREGGRFVLQEVEIPTKEYLHASREDGRLRLSLVQPPEDEGDEEEDDGV